MLGKFLLCGKRVLLVASAAFLIPLAWTTSCYSSVSALEEPPQSSSSSSPLNDLITALQALTPQAKEDLSKRMDTLLGGDPFGAPAAAAAAARGQEQVPTDQDRNLAGHLATSIRPCGQVIGLASRQEINDVALGIVDAVLAGGGLAGAASAALQVVLGTVNYDIQSVKVCYSCQDMEGQEFDFLNDNTDPTVYAAYRSYCGLDIYGYNATQSALVLIPVNNETNTIRSGALRGMLSMHGQLYGRGNEPSEFWPTALSATFTAIGLPNNIASFLNYLEAMMAVSAGAVAVLPDYLGFGESGGGGGSDGFFRAPYFHPAYMQQALAYYAAQDYVKTATNSCTTLSNTLSVTGFSEGGYGAVIVSLALKRLGFRLLGLYLNAPYLDTIATAIFSVDSYVMGLVNATNNNILMQIGNPYTASVMSIELPGLPNTGTGQKLLKPEWMDANNTEMNVISWFAPPDQLSTQDILAISPLPSVDVINPDITQLILGALALNQTRFCEPASAVPPGVDKLCETFRSFSVWDVMQMIDYPTSLCYSPQDTLITTDNFPDFIFDTNDNISRVTSLVNGLLPVTGDHLAAGITCTISAVLYYTVTGPADTVDGPVISGALSAADAATCAGSTTDAPTTNPVMAPTVAPTSAVTGTWMLAGMAISASWATVFFFYY